MVSVFGSTAELRFFKLQFILPGSHWYLLSVSDEDSLPETIQHVAFALKTSK